MLGVWVVLPKGIKALFRNDKTFNTVEPQVLQNVFLNLLYTQKNKSVLFVYPVTHIKVLNLKVDCSQEPRF